MTKSEAEDLKAEVSVLQAEMKWFREVYQALIGEAGPWLSPAQASILLCVSRDRIADEIKLAEKARITGQKFDVQYGVHYRNIQGRTSKTSTWQVQLREFRNILNKPPETRPVIK